MIIGLDAPGAAREEFEHLVERPQRIFVAEGEGLGMAIDIEDADEHKTIIRLQRPRASSDE